ncbi:MAG: DMT family transporter [Desulfovibrio sp.]|jgi:drug/metabolite transporter (DMT)-like permease|nr:DMT family transporter [Desulfovibrio sp.]
MGNAFVKLHLSILLAGFTGIFGKLIELPEGPLVWYRMLMASALFFVYLAVFGKVPKVSVRQGLRIGGVGVLIALHWIFFYGSIKYANVSIAVVCFAMTGFFTALLEPLFSRRRLSIREVLFSLVTVAGIALIFHFDSRYRAGILLGIVSAAFAALLTITMRRVGKEHASNTMLLYQMSGGFVFLTLAAPIYLWLFPDIRLTPDFPDLAYLFLLSSLCTIGMFLLQIEALRSISAFTVNLSYNLEPIYSILLAMALFGEASEVNPAFFAGLALICISVALQSAYAARQMGGGR